MRKRWEYAVYKGDECIAIGTSNEICNKLHIKRATFQYYRSKDYKKRIANRKAKNYRTIIRIDK